MEEIILNGVPYIRKDVAEKRIKENGFLITDELDKLFRPLAFILALSKIHTEGILDRIERIKALKDYLQIINRVKNNDYHSSSEAGEHWFFSFPYIENRQSTFKQLPILVQDYYNALLVIKNKQEHYKKLKRDTAAPLKKFFSDSKQFDREKDILLTFIDDSQYWKERKTLSYSKLINYDFTFEICQNVKQELIKLNNEYKTELFECYDSIFLTYKNHINEFFNTYCIGTYQGKTKKEWLMSI